MNCRAGLPEEAKEEMLEDEDFLKAFHHALLEVGGGGVHAHGSRHASRPTCSSMARRRACPVHPASMMHGSRSARPPCASTTSAYPAGRMWACTGVWARAAVCVLAPAMHGA